LFVDLCDLLAEQPELEAELFSDKRNRFAGVIAALCERHERYYGGINRKSLTRAIKQIFPSGIGAADSPQGPPK
jgi:hypothetical protein